MNDALIESLAAARKAQKITQAELAERAGLSRMAVQRTETGDVDPRYSTLAEMSRVLGMQMIAVPADLVPALQAFIQSGGKFLGQPTGADAPPSVVEQSEAPRAGGTASDRKSIPRSVPVERSVPFAEGAVLHRRAEAESGCLIPARPDRRWTYRRLMARRSTR